MSLEKLKIMAKEAANKAYAPYSKFRVGSALITKSGNVYSGCNVENASYGLTTCAERNAIANAISAEGEIEISQLVVYTPTEKATPPCGACRQVIYEFTRDATIHSYCDSEETATLKINELLPGAFDFEENKEK
ncbi:MAG: cytidine deaminase [Ekhidna sp.]